MATKTTHSIEEQVEDWCKRQFVSPFDYFTKTQSINPEIEEALRKAPSKKGGSGPNFPDIKCFIVTSTLRRIPVMVEVKGTKGDFGKFDVDGKVENKKKDGEPNYNNIAKYAINGAIHYADAILHNTESYDEVVAIGVNGYYVNGEMVKEIGVYYVSKSNLFVPKKVDDFSDLSFLLQKNVDAFVKKIDELSLSEEELEKKKIEIEDDIDRKLNALNQKLHDVQDIVVKNRVQLVAGLIMAGLGVKDKVTPLQVSDLKGELSENDNDGQIIMRKIESYLKEKGLPIEKIKMIEGILNVVFLHSGLEKPENGESRLKTIYRDIKSDIVPFVAVELHNVDFTGRLFNVMNGWVEVPDGDKNDVVLTPRYITELMAKLCKVNMESYVWDFTVGSAGFLISSMHLMIEDAKKNCQSPEELEKKISDIKTKQLLGIEKLPDVYMLAVLNMILMKDGCANIIQGNSLEYAGHYEQGELKNNPFLANVLLLNPPYSAPGCGLIFAKKAMNMMIGGKAAILIQESAGITEGLPYSKDILKKHTLKASIKMNEGLFGNKASVQVAIYVFDVGTPHNPNELVKFVDFSEDGYKRQNKKKAKMSANLKDTNDVKGHYNELIKLICYDDDSSLKYLKNKYIKDRISLNGNDWAYIQHKKTDNKPSEEDFINVVRTYLDWKVRNRQLFANEPPVVVVENYPELDFVDFPLSKMFNIKTTNTYGVTNHRLFSDEGSTPVITNSSKNNGIGGWSDREANEKGGVITYSDTTTADSIFYQPKSFIGYSHVKKLIPHDKEWDELSLLYFLVALRKSAADRFNYGVKFNDESAKSLQIHLPVIKGTECINYKYMRHYIQKKIVEVIGLIKSETIAYIEQLIQLGNINEIISVP